MEELEKKVDELKRNGQCKVKFNPYIVEIKSRVGSNTRVKMDYLSSYSEIVLIKVTTQLENSIIKEELEVRVNILSAMLENHRKVKEEKEKYYKKYVAKLHEGFKDNG